MLHRHAAYRALLSVAKPAVHETMDVKAKFKRLHATVRVIGAITQDQGFVLIRQPNPYGPPLRRKLHSIQCKLDLHL